MEAQEHWVENNGKYAYTANYTSANVSSYSIGSNGRLSLLEAKAGATIGVVRLQLPDLGLFSMRPRVGARRRAW